MIIKSLSVYILIFSLLACGNKKEESSAGDGTTNVQGGATTPVQTTPLNNQCVEQQCDNSFYNQYRQFGWIPYPQYSNYGYGAYYAGFPYDPYFNNPNHTYYRFCDCPQGYLPAYSGQFGLGCLQQSRYYAYNSSALHWSWGVSSNSWINIPQISNISGYPNSNSCYQQVLQVCLVDQANTCGGGATCIATAGGSRLGICTRQ